MTFLWCIPAVWSVLLCSLSYSARPEWWSACCSEWEVAMLSWVLAILKSDYSASIFQLWKKCLVIYYTTKSIILPNSKAELSINSIGISWIKENWDSSSSILTNFLLPIWKTFKFPGCLNFFNLNLKINKKSFFIHLDARRDAN